MIVNKGKNLSVFLITVYFLCFTFLWAIREIVIGPVLDRVLGVWTNVFISIILKLLIWVVPSIFLIQYFQEEMWLSLKEMITNKVKWRGYTLIFCGFCLYYLLAAYFTFHCITISKGFKVSALVGSVLFVGITEEAVFRAWLLNATLKRLASWPATFLNAVMFLTIHIPIWYCTNLFAHPILTLQNIITVFILSLIFSQTFIKSKNIFVPILLHTSWDFLYLIVFGWM